MRSLKINTKNQPIHPRIIYQKQREIMSTFFLSKNYIENRNVKRASPHPSDLIETSRSFLISKKNEQNYPIILNDFFFHKNKSAFIFHRI
jgi:hypothetical protein